MTIYFKIENTSYIDIVNGSHALPGKGSILIQIVDDNQQFPIPAQEFDGVEYFVFDDVNDASLPGAISISQAKAIVDILNEAKVNRKNVVVHCTLGRCRSGAVTEVATMMGFVAVHPNRQPNTLVKYLMMKCLGWTYD